MTATMKQTLTASRSSGKSAFIPFVMAGDPDMDTSEKIIIALQESGADILELGVPFSDPAADGVTVQRAAERSLSKGTTLQSVLALVKRLRGKGVTMPICLFSYLNPVYQLGYETFIKQAQAAGAQGALIVDLPPEEAADYCKAARAHHFETVFLCSPTTSAERLKQVDAASSGFVYYVSREGVTGAQSALPQQLQDKLSGLRASMTNSIAVGFGISTPEQVRQLDGKADGIVVGSALVKLIEENQNNPADAITKSVRKLKGA
jgi:tryptophan synthase alpha chain